MGEIGRCREWNVLDDVFYVNLLIYEKLNWKFELVGFGNDEMQYVYWDEVNKLYVFWVCRYKNKVYYFIFLWIMNYGLK